MIHILWLIPAFVGGIIAGGFVMALAAVKNKKEE